MLVITACSVSAAIPPPEPTTLPEVTSTTATRPGNESGSPTPELPATEPVAIQPTIDSGEPTTSTSTVVVTYEPALPAPSPTAPAQQPSPTPVPTPVGAVETSTRSSQVFSMFGSITCRDGEESVELTQIIYDPELFDTLVPMGRMWDSHVTPTDHLYVQLNGERERGMVKTPAAGRLMLVESFPRDQSPFWDSSIKEPDLRLVIAHSCTLFSVYIHVGELAPDVVAAVGDIKQGGRWFSDQNAIVELSAGDPIAVLGGSSFDYSLHDETTTLTGFQIPEHYEGEPWKVHTVDPFDYMSDELVAALLPNNARQVQPYGGRIDCDVPGTLAGKWFMDGTVDYGGGGLGTQRYWNGHLSISYDHVDPSEIRISIGRDIGLTFDDCRSCGGVYAVKGKAPDPAIITVADGIVKYELTGRMSVSADNRERTVSDGVLLGTFMAEVVDDTTIRVEFVPRVAADSLSGFSSEAVIYRR